MPGGLSEVTQVVGADASKYISEYRAALAVTKELRAAQKELVAGFADVARAMQATGGGGSGAGDIGKLNASYRETLATLKEVQPQIAAVKAATGDYASVVKVLGDSHVDTATMIRASTAAIGEQATVMQAGMRVTEAATDAVSDHAVAVERVTEATGNASGTTLSYFEKLGLVESQARKTESALGDVAARTDTLNNFLGKIPDVGSTALGALLGMEGAAGAGSGDGGASAAATSVYTAAALRAAAALNRTGAGAGVAADAATLRAAAGTFGGGGILGGGGGGGGGSSGGGGGGSFLSGLGGFFGPGPGGMSAADQFTAVGNFVKRWIGPAHYALMGINEALAVLGPAAVAAVAAGATGLQGGQQLFNRAQAINAVGQSLGPSLGQTPGSFAGMGQTLQQAQNIGGGGAYELAGAGVNIVRSGVGGAFAQLGLNTEAMIARGTATLTQDFQNGLGTKLAGIVSGGTGYLQQIGDVFGNLGKTFVNVAPNLPGVGGDYLSILQGATGGLAKATGFMGSGIAPILAFEAAARLGGPIVGGAGALLGKAGTGVAGLGDLLAGSDVLGSGVLSSIVGESGVGLAAAGGALGGLGSVGVGTLGALALLIGKGATYQTAEQQKFGAIQSQVNQSDFSQGFGTLISGMNQAAAVPYSTAPGTSGQQNYGQSLTKSLDALKSGNMGAAWSASVQGMHGVLQMLGIEGTDPSNYEVAQQKLQQFAKTFVNLSDSGKQVQAVWKGVSGSAVDMGTAMNIATYAQLQLGSAFDKNGKLSAQAQTMIKNLYAGYAPMMMNTGEFGAATGAVTAMSGLSGTKVGTVNSAYDQLTQLVSGGTSGTAALSSLMAALPRTSATAKALTSFTSPASSAAWTAFASTSQPSVVSQLESQMDWLRQAQTMNAAPAMGAGGIQGMAAYYLKQALPYGKDSPSALATLSTFGQQFGITGAYDPSKTQAQNYAAMAKSVNSMADSGKQFNKSMTATTIATSNIPRDAQQFVQTVQTDTTSAMEQAIAANSAKTVTAFQGSISKGGYSTSDLNKLTGVLKQGGTGQASSQAIITYAAKMSGATPAQINAMMAQVKKDYTVTVTGKANTSEIQKLNQEIAQLHSKVVTATAHADSSQVAALNAQIAALHDKIVTITTQLITIGGMPGVTPGIPIGIRAPGHAAGFRVPGFGGGDRHLALLEGGEAVVPKELTAAVAPFLAAHGVPGFASGMIPAGTLSGVNAQISGQWKSLDQLYASHAAKAQIDAFWKTVLDPLYAAKDKLTATTTAVSASTSTALGKLAATLGGQFTTEMNYARSVAGAAAAGQGYGTQGLISGFTATAGPSGVGAAPPGTRGYNAAAWNAAVSNAATDTPPAQTVQQQMQSYLGTVQSFTKDLHTLTKDGLSKSLISQLVAAGPTQGDALAQSILGGAGGVKGANSLWAQIGKASNAFGAQAGMSMYGGTIAPNLKSATVTNNSISVNVSVPGGAAGDLPLTNAQIKTLTEEIQAKLLQQARRNQRTGVQLRGRGA